MLDSSSPWTYGEPSRIRNSRRRDGESMPHQSWTAVRTIVEPLDARDLGLDESPSCSESLWARLLGALETTVQPTALESWLRPCRVAAVDDDHLRVVAPNEFVREWV